MWPIWLVNCQQLDVLGAASYAASPLFKCGTPLTGWIRAEMKQLQ